MISSIARESDAWIIGQGNNNLRNSPQKCIKTHKIDIDEYALGIHLIENILSFNLMYNTHIFICILLRYRR